MPPQRARPRHSAVKWIAGILAVAVHVGFVLFLIFSVNWQNRKPEPVIAELYVPAVTPKVEPPKAAPEPPSPPPEPPKPQAEPPKPEPPKPDIAVKEKQERMKKEQAERERKEKEKQDEKKQQEKRLAESRERQAREAAALQAQAERERQTQQLKAAADAAHAKADADYIRRIQAKIRGNVVLPPDMQGNPEAVFDVVQLPSGEIIDIQLDKSSGVRAYDEAVQRAIKKSSPLPRPDAPDMFRRDLKLKFRPLD